MKGFTGNRVRVNLSLQINSKMVIHQKKQNDHSENPDLKRLIVLLLLYMKKYIVPGSKNNK